MAADPNPQPGLIRRIAILGNGLIGSSLGLALRRAGFDGAIFGWDRDPATLMQARALGAVDPAPLDPVADDPFIYALAADLIVLAGPVFAIAEWLDQLAPVLSSSQLVTDVGSVKSFLVTRAQPSYNGPKQPVYLPGHPLAGKEQSGCFHAEGTLFHGATWLFTPETGAVPHSLASAPAHSTSPPSATTCSAHGSATCLRWPPPLSAPSSSRASKRLSPPSPNCRAAFKVWAAALSAR